MRQIILFVNCGKKDDFIIARIFNCNAIFLDVNVYVQLPGSKKKLY